MNEKLATIQSIVGTNVSNGGENYLLVLGDAIDTMSKLKDKSIDLICTDLPYNVTKNKWDVMLPLDKMWEQFNRIITHNGVIALTAVQPFTSLLVMSNINNFKYDLVWEKTIASGQLNVKKRPLRVHESILIFQQDGTATYNEQLSAGTPYKIHRKGIYNNNDYNKQKASSKINDGYRHAKSIIKISNPRIRGGHPTQKPIQLMDYIIKTYSNVGDLVLDCCMGSGTTGVSAILNERLFCGIELDECYFNAASKRILDIWE